MAEHRLIEGPTSAAGADDLGAPPIPPAQLDAAAAAEAMKTAGRSPALARDAADYFKRQSRLVDRQSRLVEIQTEHLHEQRALQISRLRWGRFSDRVRAALQIMTAVVGLIVAVGLGGAIWTAARSDSVVVDAFTGPPDLAAKGLTGEVLASKLLDNLTMLQSQTRASQTKRGLKDAWSGDIKLEVPETGVSVSEMMRFMRGWLGHETHIGGDLEETPDGVSLTVRGEGVLPKTFTGAQADLPKLVTAAAEYVYGQSEPYLFASYLENKGRDQEALDFVTGAFQKAAPADRPYLLNAWADALGDLGRNGEALSIYRQALREKPDFWIAYNNVENSLWALGDEEGAWRVGQEMLRRAGGRPGRAPETYYQNVDTLTWNLQAFRKITLDDMAANGGAGSVVASQGGVSLADADARMHDPNLAALDLASTPQTDITTMALTHFVRGFAALDQGDYGRAASEMEAFGAGYASPVVADNYPGYDCWIAPAEEMAGHPDKADAVLAAGGHFVDCYRFRGDILDQRGDWAGAQRAYAAAVALAPDLPAGYYSWGLALARHGDLRGAITKLAQANAHGPHWADPLKSWGDALAAEHRPEAAAAKYAEALKYAPNWASLRSALGHAQRSGHG